VLSASSSGAKVEALQPDSNVRSMTNPLDFIGEQFAVQQD